MAIKFDSSDGDGIDYLQNTSPSFVAAPLTFSAWINVDTVSDGDCIISIADSSLSNQYFALSLNRDWVEAVTRDGGSARSYISGLVAEEWHHVAAVFASTTSRVAYLDGVAATANTSIKNPTGIDLFQIGQLASTGSKPLDGSIAEVGIWDSALTTEEILSMAGGLVPTQVQPKNLVSYYPLVRNYIDLLGNNVVVPSNREVWSEHPIAFEPAPLTGMPAWGGI